MTAQSGGYGEPMADDDLPPHDVDERFSRVLEGLRTTLPGVEVLFAFLLALPLQERFGDLTAGERRAYITALISAAVSTILLIAPSMHQRMRTPFTGLERRHLRHVMFGVYLGIGGSLAFAVALVSGSYLALSIAFAVPVAIAVVLGVGAIAVWAWFWIPLFTFRRDDRRDGATRG
jgi:hypothetical protein